MGATASRLPRRSHPVAAVQPQADGDTLTMNPPRALRVVACCLIIHTAVTILLVQREMPLPACKCTLFDGGGDPFSIPNLKPMCC